jgi:integrase
MDVARWLASMAQRQVNPATIRSRMTAINYTFERAGKGAAHGRHGTATRRSPARDLVVLQTFRGILRKHGRPPTKKAPILLDSLEKMIDGQPDTLLGIRNRALLVLGWGAALRTREIEMLDAAPGGKGDGWIEIQDDGVLVALRRSKTNQNRRRIERYGVPARPSAPKYCPVRLLRAWLRVAKISSGPLFLICQTRFAPRRKRLQKQAIRRMVKSAADGIGLDDHLIGAHSLRAGCLTWLNLEGVNPYRIKNHSGHRSIQSLLDYIRPPITPKSSPLMETRWAR